MKCVNVLGGSSKSRLDCSAALARLLAGKGGRVAYLAPWNRSGDPDPYQSSPFQELHLVSPEAGLSYRRPGRGVEDVIPTVSAEWLIVDGIPVECRAVVACGPDHGSRGPAATWGFSIPGVPGVDDPAFSAMIESLQHEDPAPRCGGGCATGGVVITIAGTPLDLSGFPSRIVEGVVTGLVSSLRGYSESGEIVVRISRDKV